MKNNIFILIFLIFNLCSLTVYAGEQFNFDVTEIALLEKE